MPTTLSSFASSEFQLRYKTPYVSESLNQKLAGVIPRGIYKGFFLDADPGAGDRTVRVVADPDDLDHLAVFLTSTGYSITVKRTGGNFLLSLVALSSKTIALCVYASYSVGATTTAQLRAYEISPVDEFSVAPERNDLVVLGTVVVPAGGAIVNASIKPTYRDLSALNVAHSAVPFIPVVKDSSFESGLIGMIGKHSTHPYWYSDQLIASSKWRMTNSAAKFGSKCASFYVGAGASSGELTQVLDTPIYDQQLIKVEVWVKVLEASAVGSLSVYLYFGDEALAGFPSALITPIDVTAVDASWRKVEQVWRVPPGLGFRHLRGASLKASGLTFIAALGDKILVDGFQVYVEDGNSTAKEVSDTLLNMMAAYSVLFRDKMVAFDAKPAVAYLDSTTPAGIGSLILDQAEGTAGTEPPVLWPKGRIHVGGEALTTARMFGDFNSNSGSDRSLLMEFNDTGSGGATRKIRVYLGQTNGGGNSRQLFITLNASYSPSLWYRDDATEDSILVSIGTYFAVQYYPLASGDGWADAAWLSNQLIAPLGHVTCRDGSWQVTNPSTGASGSNPPTTFDVHNELVAKTIPKGWGHVTTGTTPIVPNNGINITSVACPTATTMLVTLVRSFADANYAVSAHVRDTTAYHAQVVAQAAGTFTLSVFDMAGALQTIDGSGGSITVDVVWSLDGMQS